VCDLLTEFEEEYNVGIKEFETNLGLLRAKAQHVIDFIDVKEICQVIDTHHLERFYTSIIDFHDMLLRGKSRDNLDRHFRSHRLRGSLERLSLSMQYEFGLFCDYMNSLTNGNMFKTSTYKRFSAWGADVRLTILETLTELGRARHCWEKNVARKFWI
jgi:hypothetical protein